MVYSLFLDDERFPPAGKPPVGGQWLIARSFDEARALIEAQGMPAFVSFDHDLSDGPTGHDPAKWLIERDIDGTSHLPEAFMSQVHSMNPIGARNIAALLKGYLRQRVS